MYNAIVSPGEGRGGHVGHDPGQDQRSHRDPATPGECQQETDPDGRRMEGETSRPRADPGTEGV